MASVPYSKQMGRYLFCRWITKSKTILGTFCILLFWNIVIWSRERSDEQVWEKPILGERIGHANPRFQQSNLDATDGQTLKQFKLHHDGRISSPSNKDYLIITHSQRQQESGGYGSRKVPSSSKDYLITTRSPRQQKQGVYGSQKVQPSSKNYLITTHPHRQREPGGYGSRKLSPSDPAFFEMHNCTGSLGKTLEEDLKVIQSYPVTTNQTYIHELGIGTYKPVHDYPDVPVFVSAANDKYYGVAEALFKNMHEVMMPRFPWMKLIFYDLGLTPHQVSQMKKYCKCEYRKFPFEKFPPYVSNLKEYRWKPIVIQYVLVEHPLVFFVDVSMRFEPIPAKEYIDKYFRPVRYYGILYRTSGWPMTYMTHKNMFSYLKEPPCLFKKWTESATGLLLFARSKMIQILTDPWVSCALDEFCMSAGGQKIGLCKPPRDDVHIGACHRFEQSFLSILTARIHHHHKRVPRFSYAHIKVKRGHEQKYFPEK